MVEFELTITSILDELSGIPIVIFQGELDRLTKPKAIQDAALDRRNVEVLVVRNAFHHDAVTKPGLRYFDKVCSLIE